MKGKMTQAQIDREVVKGWLDCAIAARVPHLEKFYGRLLDALDRASQTQEEPHGPS